MRKSYSTKVWQDHQEQVNTEKLLNNGDTKIRKPF